MTNYERIKAIVSNSSVSAEDKQIIIDMFAEVSDESLSDIANLFEKSPDWVIKFNDNRKSKLKAATTSDANLWDEILEQEKKYLQELTYGLD